MGLPVTVYRWDDAGAPQLDGALTSSVITLLKKCLVEGYGDKEPLGWTLEDEDIATQKVAFRNSVLDGGSGGYLVVTGHTGNDDTEGLRIQSAMDMNGFEVLVNPGYKHSFKVFDSTYKTTAWVLIGNATGFALHTSVEGLSYPIVTNLVQASIYAGELDTVISNDNGSFIVFSAFFGDDTDPSSSTTGTGSGWGNSLAHYSYDSSLFDNGFLLITDTVGIEQTNYRIIKPKLDMSKEGIGVSPSAPNVLFPLLVRNNISDATEFEAVDREGTIVAESLLQPLIRGAIKGLFSSAVGIDRTLPWPSFVNIGGTTYLLMPVTSKSYMPILVINAEEW